MNLKSVPFALIVLALGVLPSSLMAQAAPADATTSAADEPATAVPATAVPAAEPAAAEPEDQEEETPPVPAEPTDPAQADPSAAPSAAAEEEAAPEAPADEPLAWRNSFFSWTQGVTLASFDRGAFRGDYNPTYYHSFSLNPRWYIDPQTFFWLNLGAFVEATQDDSSSIGANEFSLFDAAVELRRVIAWEGFIFLPSVRLTLPLSKLSQAAQRIANTGAGLIVVRPIPEAAGMTIAGVFRYTRWWATSNLSNSPDGLCIGQADCSRPNELDRFTAGVSINITPLEHLTVTVGAFWFWLNGYQLATANSGAVTASGNDSLPDGSNHWRNFASYSLSVAYDPVEWLNVSIGWSNSTFFSTFMNGDGTRVRNPFDLQESPEQQVTLSLQMTLDTFYSSLAHPTGEHDDGLTPEERQRRRQGLGSRDTDDNESDVQSRSARF